MKSEVKYSFETKETTSSGKPNMKRDLQKGKLGELNLLRFLSSDFVRTGTNKNDLINTVTGVKIEVKNEDYTHERVAIEQYSNKKFKTIGGVHKAKRDGCKYIVHIFKKTNVAVIFDVDKLLTVVGEPSSFEAKFGKLSNCKPFNKYNNYDADGKKVKNPWITKGYAVPLTYFPKTSYKIVKLQEGLNLDSFLI